MSVVITQYKWAGSWGPFSIKIPCGECAASEGIIQDMLENEFEGESVSLLILPWLDTWWKPLLKGGWHAPIIMVNGRIVSQGKVIDRGLLGYYVRKALAKEYVPQDNVIFSKPGCSHCKAAKEALERAEISYEDKNIITDPLAAQQLFALTKKIFPSNKLVSVPQVWLDGKYIGNAEKILELEKNGKLKSFS